MMNEEAYQQLKATCAAAHVTLIAVSKTKTPEEILELYALGHRDFGENYVQELIDKQAVLPQDIRWHFIGHLQSNKVKQIVPFIHFIQSVDSVKLLYEINKQAIKIDRKINCLLQMHVAQEDTKYGMDEMEIDELMSKKETLTHINFKGMMGMASLTQNKEQVKAEFVRLKSVFDHYFNVSTDILSMGMSGDYELAIQQGSNMIRVGSLLFGARQ